MQRKLISPAAQGRLTDMRENLPANWKNLSSNVLGNDAKNVKPKKEFKYKKFISLLDYK